VNVLERVLTTIRFEEPDQVPVVLFPEWDFLADLYDVPLRKLLNDPVLQIKAGNKMREMFPDAFIATGVWVPYAEATAFGCKLSDPEDEIPGIMEVAVKSVEDIDTLEVPDPYQDGLLPRYLEFLKVQKREAGQVLGVGGFGPVELACEIMGFTQFLRLISIDPERAHRLLRVTTETVKTWFDTMIDVIGGSALLALVSDHTTGFLRAEKCTEFFTPYLKEVFDHLRGKVSIFLYHNENYSAHVLDQIAEFKVQIFHCGEIGDLRRAKEATYGKYTLMGNIHPRDVMLRGTPEMVEEKCKEVIEALAPGGGFILSVGGGVSRKIPLEHIEVLIRSAEKYGRYPITGK